MRANNSLTRMTLAGCLLAMSGLTATAYAQAQATNDGLSRASADEIETIVVTAQRREENYQDVPTPIRVLQPELIERLQLNSMNDVISKVPALSTVTVSGPGIGGFVFMRGVQNSGSERGVGVYIDDVYAPTVTALENAFFDLERVEVLPGPQGTLYGRNTVGGAVKFVTAKPAGKLGLSQSVDLGNYGYFRSSTKLDLPEYAGFSASLAALIKRRDGWVHNPGVGPDYNVVDQKAYRAAIRWQPADRFVADYTFDNIDIEDTPQLLQRGYNDMRNAFTFPLFPYRLETAYRDVDTEIAEDERETRHALTAELSFSDSVSLKSVTAYTKNDFFVLKDTVEGFNVASFWRNRYDADYFQQELILRVQPESANLDAQAGLFYFAEDTELMTQSVNNAMSLAVPYVPPTVNDLRPPAFSREDNKSYAVYGHLSWFPDRFDSRLRVDLGARYSRDERHADGIRPSGDQLEPGESSYTSFDPSLTVDYRFTDSVHAFAKYTTGYRAGGFNLYQFGEAAVPYDQETLSSYELGIKSQALAGKLIFNANAFFSNYDDIQITVFIPTGIDTATRREIRNAGSAEIWGVETELEFQPLPGLFLRGDITYLDSRNKQVNPATGETSNDPLPVVPEWKGVATIDYTIDLQGGFDLSLLGSFDWVSSRIQPSAEIVTQRAPGCEKLDVNFRLGGISFGGNDDASVSLWSKNLLDAECQTRRFYSSVTYETPRTYGATLNIRF